MSSSRLRCPGTLQPGNPVKEGVVADRCAIRRYARLPLIIDLHVSATGGAHPADVFSGGSCYAWKFEADRLDTPASVISIKPVFVVLVVARAEAVSLT